MLSGNDYVKATERMYISPVPISLFYSSGIIGVIKQVNIVFTEAFIYLSECQLLENGLA